MYGLRDPETKEIRYVGRTNNIARRFSEHLKLERSAQSHKKAWIKSLLQKGLTPEIVILAQCSEKQAAQVETDFIKTLPNLTNHPGKDGSFGFSYGAKREEIRKVVIGKCITTGEEVELNGIYSSLIFNGDQISKCINGQCRVHKGFGWKLKGDPLFSHETPRIRSQGYGVIRIDSFGNEVYYEKVTDAVGFSSSGIQRACNGSVSVHKGYKWKWAAQVDRFRFTGKSDKIAFQRNKKRT